MKHYHNHLIIVSISILILAGFLPVVSYAVTIPTDTTPAPINHMENFLHPSDSEQWYEFHLEAGEGISCAYTPHVNSGGLAIRLYDEEGKDLDSEFAYNGETDIISYKAVLTGNYYVRISGEPTGNYDFGVYEAWFNSDITDRDRDFYATMYTARYIQSGNYNHLKTLNDYFRFHVKSGNKITVSYTPYVNSGGLAIRLYDEEGKDLDSEFAYNGETDEIIYSIILSGYYYIRISGDVNGNYDLMVSGICSSSNPALCNYESDCLEVGNNWCSEQCQSSVCGITGKIITSLPGYTTSVSGAKITLTGNSTTLTAISDINGNYKFAGISGGTYTIRIEKENFTTVIIKNVSVSEGETTKIPEQELSVTNGFDINGDGKIGLQEAVHILQIISGLR